MLIDCVVVLPLVPVFVCGFPACVFVFVPLFVGKTERSKTAQNTPMHTLEDMPYYPCQGCEIMRLPHFKAAMNGKEQLASCCMEHGLPQGDCSVREENATPSYLLT